MSGRPQLLFLAVLVLQARCQRAVDDMSPPTPQLLVSISPALNQIYSGDLFYLTCGEGVSGGEVTWFFNNSEQNKQKEKTWKIEIASPTHSGHYYCVTNGDKSNTYNITVLDYVPRASLTIYRGRPVMLDGDEVVLQLQYEPSPKGWQCWVYGGSSSQSKILRAVKKDTDKMLFFPGAKLAPETIYWCTDDAQTRSNQVRARISNQKVTLEMYPLPAIAGESLTLRCIVWGTDQISNTVFYKDEDLLYTSQSPVYKISNVTESEMGRYKCRATFKYRAQTVATPHTMYSDYQDVLVQVPPIRALLTENTGLSCSCPLCPSERSYHWYRKGRNDQQWTIMESKHQSMKPEESATYACKAVWKSGKSYMSIGHVYQSRTNWTLLLAIIGLVIILIVAATVIAFYKWYKRRAEEKRSYEEVPMRSGDKDDNLYEILQPGDKREREYDGLRLKAASTEKKEGDYERLKKEEMQEGAYDTMQVGEAAGGDGGYEALNKETTEEGPYHTLETGKGAGGEGGYEALNKEKMEEGPYHTLETGEGAGGEGQGIRH